MFFFTFQKKINYKIQLSGKNSPSYKPAIMDRQKAWNRIKKKVTS